MPQETEWRELLRILLAQRLELNALETALKTASILTAGQIHEIRRHSTDTATAWSSQEGDDLLELLRVHSSPPATMLVPKVQSDDGQES